MEKEKKIELPEAFVKKMEELLGSDAEPFLKVMTRSGNSVCGSIPLKQKNGWTADAGTPLEELPERTRKSTLGEGRILLRGRYAPGTPSVS